MNRRTFLASAGALAALTLAGCVVVMEPKAYIDFRRTGGFAGVDQRLAVNRDGSGQLTARGMQVPFTLSTAEMARLVALFSEADFASLDAEYRPIGTVFDAYQYEITFDGHTVRTEDTAVPPQLEPVVAALSDLIQAQLAGSGPSAPLTGGVLATFNVNDASFKVWVTNEKTITALLALLTGESAATIPNGRILRGSGAGDHNAPYSWHLDPQDIEMAEVTMELCDGAPSYVEDNVDEFADTIGRYCPWAAELAGVEDWRAFIRYQRTGGFAGFNDVLTIDPDGNATVTDRSGNARTFTLDAEAMQALLAAFAAADFGQMDAAYVAEDPIADGFAYRVTYDGHIVQTTDTVVPEALQTVLTLLDELLQP